MTKIVQIACSESADGSSLFALTDAGDVLQLHEQQTAVDKATHTGVGVWTAFWRPLPELSVRLPVFVSTVDGKTERNVVPHHYVERIERAAKAKTAAKALTERASAVSADVF
ncbi:hypothetical protein R69619_00403 [Paraburkholderia nemoris]|uniref:hypothetical protein n=1 Tax=Paraburkholderia nemoris TaxID=2793076 RepID=UPI00190C35A0|nr:hypothetical protein [Paraburkholderia nemoris]MBK3737667.1 hypothetical protein [Paraburkholderia aspalathi]CAE6694327.1 hypothetical protein R69619_00403 [Paraburkholderia nemoris]